MTRINVNGWICGWGENGTSTQAFVLVPIDDYKDNWCRADVANSTALCPDGVVNVFDLLTLLYQWGPCLGQ